MKNKIQILILSLVAIMCWWFWISQAYVLTGEELEQVNSQKAIINDASDYGVRDYYLQLSKWYNILKNDDKLGTISEKLRDYAYSVFSTRKSIAKKEWKDLKSEFLGEYADNIIMDSEFPLDKCTWRYNTIDSISFANNFPTALTIAIRYRETTCGYYLPANGDGPFQIVSLDYGTGEITEEIFKQSIQDFIDFAKKKIDTYNAKADEEFPEINLTYTWFDLTGMVSFAALYNGWTRTGWVVEPNAPEYVYDGYGEWHENTKRFGVLAAFLNILDWELENS